MYLERTPHSNRLYRIWTEFRRRCRKPRQQSYIEKKLTYDKSWNEYMTFREWSLSNGYNDSLSIDRIDNDKGYYPDNCRWATRSEQQSNQSKRRNCSSMYKGINYDKKRNKWRLRISGKHIGYYETELIAYEESLTYCA